MARRKGSGWHLVAAAALLFGLVSSVVHTTRATGPIYPISLVSVGLSGGGTTGGGGGSNIPYSISDDGRYIGFESQSADLVNGDTNGRTDAFVYDRQTSTTRRVSTTSTDAQASGQQPILTADGSLVYFLALSSELNPGGFGYNLYRKDLSTGAVSFVNTPTGSNTPSPHANSPDISADGRWATWWSDSAYLVPGDTNATTDVFLKDTLTNTTSMISVNSAGQESDGMSRATKISDNGRYVAFWSQGTNLVANDTDTCYGDPVLGKCPDIFLRDTQTGTTTLVSVDENGINNDQPAGEMDMNSDGSVIAYDNPQGLLVWRASTGTSTLIASGAGQPSLSDDGTRVAYMQFGNVYVTDLTTNETHLVSQSPNGDPPNSPYTGKPLLSGDGKTLAFESWATNLTTSPITGDGNQVYVATLVEPDTTAPTVGAAVINPNPKATNQTATLSATVSDTQTGVTRAEYFMGADPGVGNGTAMTISNGVATAPIGTNFAVGKYGFNVRAMDGANNWSTTSHVNLDVYDPAAGYAAGHGFITPGGASSDPGDVLPTVSGNHITATLDFTVRYLTPTSTIPTGANSFVYGSNNCDKNNTCFTVDTTSFAWLLLDNTNHTAEFQGLASLTLNGQSLGGNYPVRVSVNETTDHYLLQVFSPGADPDTDSPLYQASGDLSGGNIKLHKN